MQQPKVIFLDAVGTLFGVRGSVGELYSEVARQFGVEVAADVLESAFYHSYRHSTPMAFPGVEPANIAIEEFKWWDAIVRQTFQQVGAFHQFSDFNTFSHQLYTYFATADPWFVYPDVPPVLEYWRRVGIELGVVSNFDTRLYSVLKALNLEEFFTSVTISTEIGAAKPESEIFIKSLQKHDCLAEAAWHIGDSFKEDYQGSKAAGLRAIWLKRR